MALQSCPAGARHTQAITCMHSTIDDDGFTEQRQPNSNDPGQLYREDIPCPVI